MGFSSDINAWSNCVLCTVYCEQCVLCTVYSVYCEQCVLCTVYSVYCEQCTVYCVLCTVYCVLCTVLYCVRLFSSIFAKIFTLVPFIARSDSYDYDVQINILSK